MPCLTKEKLSCRDTTTIPHYISKCCAVSHHEKCSVGWLWCRCGVPGLWTKVGTCGPPYLLPLHSLAQSLFRGVRIIEMYEGQCNLSFAPPALHFLPFFGCIEIHCCYGNVDYTCLPRDAVLHAISLCPPVRPSVRHKPVLYRNDWTDQGGFWHGGFVSPIPHCVIRKHGCQK